METLKRCLVSAIAHPYRCVICRYVHITYFGIIRYFQLTKELSNASDYFKAVQSPAAMDFLKGRAI